jgi:OPA family glycerol-3-phosphate transporter-like MFS transporter
MSNAAAFPQLPAGFRQRRAINWVLAGAMYAFFYMARYNFAAINAYLADQFGWTNTVLGYFDSAATLVYGCSVFLNGPLADRIGGRRAILFGAAGTALLNLLFGFGHLFLGRAAVWEGEGKLRHVVTPAHMNFGMTSTTVIALLITVWTINFYFQSFGALSIVKINAAWFHVRERGLFSGIFGILIRAGLLLAFSGSPFILALLPWQWVFWIPGACIAVLVIASYVYVQNTPTEAGLPTLDTGDGAQDEEEEEGPTGLAFVLKKVFASSTMWTIALASMMIGFVRRSVVDSWWPKYFVNVHHANAKALTSYGPYEIAAWGIAIAGIIGGLTFGSMSDRVFGGRRAPVVVIGFVGQAVVLLVFGLLNRGGAAPTTAALCIVALSFFVNGAHGMVGGAASMDFGGKKAAATAAGLFDGVQYIAGAIVGISLGRLLDTKGWGIWPFVPIPFAIAGALIMSRLWNVLPGRRAH